MSEEPVKHPIPLKVLVACESSGVVRDAFNALGHVAMSCDLLEADNPGPHYKGDVRDLLKEKWDLVIAHPPCTYLNVAAAWAFQDPDNWFDANYGAGNFESEAEARDDIEELRYYCEINQAKWLDFRVVKVTTIREVLKWSKRNPIGCK